MKKNILISIFSFLLFCSLFSLSKTELSQVRFHDITGENISVFQDGIELNLEDVHFFPQGENEIVIETGNVMRKVSFRLFDRGDKIQNLYVTPAVFEDSEGFLLDEFAFDEAKVYSLSFIVEENLFAVVVNEIMTSVERDESVFLNYSFPVIDIGDKNVKVLLFKNEEQVLEKILAFDETRIPPLNLGKLSFSDKVILVDIDWLTCSYENYLSSIPVGKIEYKGDFSEFRKVRVLSANDEDRIFVNGYWIGNGYTEMFVVEYSGYDVKVLRTDGSEDHFIIEAGNLPESISF